MVVYVRGFRERVEKIAEELGEAAFHGKMSDQEKKRVLGEFTEGKSRVVVATNALGMGIDIPDIRIVVHIDAPDSLRHYGQESGRAGRDGLESRAIMVKKAEQTRDGEEVRVDLYARIAMRIPGHRAMQDFIDGETCRRVAMERYLDGIEEREGCKKGGFKDGRGEVACDVCRRTQPQPREDEEDLTEEEDGEEVEMRERGRREGWEADQIREQGRDAVARRSRFEDELRQMAEAWSEVCAICKSAGRQGRGSVHPTSACQRMEEKGSEIKGEIGRVRAAFQMEDYAGCRGCGFPQGLCEMWTSTTTGFRREVGKRCQWRYVMIDVVVTLMFRDMEKGGEDEEGETETERIFARIEGEGVRISESQQVYRWYGRRIKIGDVETNRLCQVFHQLVGAFQR